MLSFQSFVAEARVPGKNIGALYVHKDYVTQSQIPATPYQDALGVLRSTHPEFQYTIVKYDPTTRNVSFLHSPDWDTADEPLMDAFVTVGPSGIAKSGKSHTIYHQKWQMVGDDYTGFNVAQSKQRTKDYQEVIRRLASERGVPTREISSRIGSPEYWQREIVPHLAQR